MSDCPVVCLSCEADRRRCSWRPVAEAHARRHQGVGKPVCWSPRGCLRVERERREK